MNIYTQSLSTAKASACLPNGLVRRHKRKEPFLFQLFSCISSSLFFFFFLMSLFQSVFTHFPLFHAHSCFHLHLLSFPFSFLFPVLLVCVILVYFSLFSEGSSAGGINTECNIALLCSPKFPLAVDTLMVGDKDNGS